jgi:hypothetical protein
MINKSGGSEGLCGPVIITIGRIVVSGLQNDVF